MSEKRCAKCRGLFLSGWENSVVDEDMVDVFWDRGLRAGDYICYDCFHGLDCEPDQPRHDHFGRA